MPNKKINELSPRTPSLTDLIIVGDPSTGYSYKATISVLTAFAGSNIQFSSLGGISLTSPANGQVLQFNGTSWVNYTPTTWNTAYDRSLVSAAVSGSTTKTLTLTKQDGSTLTATWSDLNTDAVTSVFGRTGAVVATDGDYSLDLLSDVTLSTPTTNQVLQYNGTAWVNATFVAGINSLNGLTATTQTFATGTSGTDFAISSTTSTHTFNLPTASATNRGALSSADWTTFNSKVGGSGTTNYLSKWTGTSALGNSLVFDNGTNVGIGTASPAYNLDITGSLRNTDNVFLSTISKSVSIGDATTTNTYNGTTLQIYDASANRRTRIILTNNLYGPTGTFGFNLGVQQTTAFVSNEFNGPLTFSTNASEKMRLTSSGRLLIGTTTESTFELDVVGDIRSTLDANINGLTVGKGGGSVATNTAVGFQAINGSATGTVNTAIGYRSLEGLTSGSNNTAVGNLSLYRNSTAIYNTAIGSNASQAITTGRFNTSVGVDALYSAVSGEYNTMVGVQSGYNVTGNYNTGLGMLAARGITSGIYNTFIGANDASYAGSGITTGNYNVIIGSNLSGLSSSLSNTIILADGQGNQRLYINNSGNVGIGTTSPTRKLVVVSSDWDNTNGSGVIFENSNTVGAGVTLKPSSSVVSNGSNGWAVYAGSTGAAIGDGNLGFWAHGTNQSRLVIQRTGNVGIGTNSPSQLLEVRTDQNAKTAILITNTTNNTGAFAQIEFATSSSQNASVGKYNPLTTTNKIIAGGDAYLFNSSGYGDIAILNDFATGRIKFAAGGSSTSQMTLFSNGNLGVGTGLTDAGYKLDVNGTAAFRNNVDIARTGNGSISLNIINQTSGNSVDANLQLVSSGGRMNLGKYSASTSAYKFIASNDGYIYNSTGAGDISILNDFASGAIKFGAGGTSTAQMILTSGGSLGIGTSSPNASALLDVSSTTKGFLPPRMTNAQMVAIATPASGLIVYDTTNNKLNVYDGTNWVAVH